MRALLEIQKEGCHEELQGWWHLGARVGVQRFLTAWRVARDQAVPECGGGDGQLRWRVCIRQCRILKGRPCQVAGSIGESGTCLDVVSRCTCPCRVQTSRSSNPMKQLKVLDVHRPCSVFIAKDSN